MANTIQFLTLLLLLAACQNKKGDEEPKTPNDSVNQEIIKPGDSELSTSFVWNEGIVEKTFLEYLPSIAGNRVLNRSPQSPDGKGYKIVLGDLNGDGLTDAVVAYSLEATLDDTGGGGNAIGEISGLLAYINTSKDIILADHSRAFAMSSLTKITDGTIILEGLIHGENDPRCCPSIKTTTRVVLKDNKLTETN